jgi:hypothetical protein
MRARLPSFFAAGSLFFAELGLMALADALIVETVAKNVVVGMLGAGAFVTILMYVVLVRRWRASNREQPVSRAEET